MQRVRQAGDVSMALVLLGTKQTRCVGMLSPIDALVLPAAQPRKLAMSAMVYSPPAM
jgi:hypothetical protein